MIDYEKIAEAAVIMSDFASELRELCGRYSKKLKELVSEKCLTGIELVPRLFAPTISLSSFDYGVTEQEVIEAGFTFVEQSASAVYPCKEYVRNIQGVTVRAMVLPDEKRRTW